MLEKSVEEVIPNNGNTVHLPVHLMFRIEKNIWVRMWNGQYFEEPLLSFRKPLLHLQVSIGSSI
jgi:hypothetical protein